MAPPIPDLNEIFLNTKKFVEDTYFKHTFIPNDNMEKFLENYKYSYRNKNGVLHEGNLFSDALANQGFFNAIEHKLMNYLFYLPSFQTFLLKTVAGKKWIETPSGKYFLLKEVMMKIKPISWMHDTLTIEDDIMEKFLLNETETEPSDAFIPDDKGIGRFKLKDGFVKRNNGVVVKLSDNGKKLFDLLDNPGMNDVLKRIFYDDYGKAFLETRPFQTIWLKRESGKKWLKTPYGRKWLGTPSGKAWTETPAGEEWLLTDFKRSTVIRHRNLYANALAIQRNLAKEEKEKQEERVYTDIIGRILRLYYIEHKYDAVKKYFNSPDANILLEMLNDSKKRDKVLQSDIGKELLAVGPFQTKWLTTPAGKQWIADTNDGWKWIRSDEGFTWCNKMKNQLRVINRPAQCDMDLIKLKENFNKREAQRSAELKQEQFNLLTSGFAYGGGGSKKHRSHKRHYKRKTYKKRKNV